jgi:YidC/Oxa1 family membrane protein insertase
MKDKNTIIGIVLLASLFFIFFYYTNKQQQATLAFQKEKSRKDSIANACQSNTHNKKKLQHLIQYVPILLERLIWQAIFQVRQTFLNNWLLLKIMSVKITFTNKGGRAKSVELKKYNSQTGG